ncbi:MAG: PrpF domain-containing protein, partial [Polaromonas sp.]
GKLFPTGQRIDVIDGLEATCIYAAMPLMILRAGDLGLTGRERPAELDANSALLARIEAMRRMAGARMGLGDVSDSVIPKPVLVSAGDGPLSITSRYFTPRRCHASHAVTGAIGVATTFALPSTVASGIPGRQANTRSRCCTRPDKSILKSSWKAKGRTPPSSAPRWCAPPARSCRANCTCQAMCSRRPARSRPPAPGRHCPFPARISRSSCPPAPAAATTPWPAR